MKLNEYKISDFPNFDLQSDSNNIRLDFPSLISDYIYDLEDGLNIKLHAEKEDEYGYLYDEFNLKDLQYYCDIKNLDYKFPKWIESLSIKVYQNNDELEKDIEMNGFVNIPVDDKSDITYNSDTQKINISNFTVYSWKNKEYTKKVISHELTHCYDFYKKFITGDSTFNLVDKNGNWKSVYDLEHEDNLFLYGVKADEFRDQIKELDPDNYSLYKNKALEILKDSSLWKDNDNLSVFCLVVCELFYYLDTSEMKAFYVSGKDVKEIYQDIYNICSKFPDISDKMLRKLSENSELSDMFRKFIFNVLGIKLKNNLSEYLKEIQFELIDDAHDAAMLFKQNLLNEALLQWDDSDTEDIGIIKVSDVENKIKIPEEFIGRERPNNNGELYILIGDIRNTLGAGTKENPIDLNWIDLSIINQAEWTNNINGIFAGNANGTFEYIDISKWDVSGMKSIADLFYNNEYIKSVGNLSKWQTSNIENMHRAFCGCINLEYIGDLSNWKLDNVKDISQMFCHTHKLKWVGDLSSWTSTVESLPNQSKYGCIAYAGFNPDKFDWSWLFRKKPVVESLLIDWGNSNNQENTGILSKEDIRQAFKKMPILSWKTYDKNKEEVTKIVKHLIDLIIETGITKPMSVYRYTAQLNDTNLGAFQVMDWRALSNIGYDTIQILEIFLEKNNLLPKEDIQKYVDLYNKHRAVKEENIYFDPLEETHDFKPGSKEYYDTFMKIVNKFNHDPNILKYRQIAPEEHRTVADAWQMFTFIWNKPIGNSNEYFYFYLVMPLQEDTGIDPELTLILSGVPASELLIK